jgi:hypothetical protein
MTIRCDRGHIGGNSCAGVRRNRGNQGFSNHNSALLAMCLIVLGCDKRDLDMEAAPARVLGQAGTANGRVRMSLE